MGGPGLRTSERKTVRGSLLKRPYTSVYLYKRRPRFTRFLDSRLIHFRSPFIHHRSRSSIFLRNGFVEPVTTGETRIERRHRISPSSPLPSPPPRSRSIDSNFQENFKGVEGGGERYEGEIKRAKKAPSLTVGCFATSRLSLSPSYSLRDRKEEEEEEVDQEIKR